MSKIEIIDKDRGWAKLMEQTRQIRDGRVRVGVLADTEKGAAIAEGADLTVAEIAAVNEFGDERGHVPERSFLRSTFDAKREELARMCETLIKRVLDGMPTLTALNILGAKLASDVKLTITGGVPPPNAPATIRAKGSSKPLVDTGRLLNAVTWVVTLEKGSDKK